MVLGLTATFQPPNRGNSWSHFLDCSSRPHPLAHPFKAAQLLLPKPSPVGCHPFLIQTVRAAWRAGVLEKGYKALLSWRASAVSPKKSLAWVEEDLAIRPGSAAASYVTLSNPVLWASCDWLSGQSLEDGNWAVFPLQPSTDLRARHPVSRSPQGWLERHRERREQAGDLWETKDSAPDSAKWRSGVPPPSRSEQVREDAGSMQKPRMWFAAWISSVSSCLSPDKPGLFDCVPRAGRSGEVFAWGGQRRGSSPRSPVTLGGSLHLFCACCRED